MRGHCGEHCRNGGFRFFLGLKFGRGQYSRNELNDSLECGM